MAHTSKKWLKPLGRALALLALCTLALQVFFALRVAALAWVDPASTSFQRSEAWRLLRSPAGLRWRHEWAPLPVIAPALQRAVIASEDAGFNGHGGVEWGAIESAWSRNRAAQARQDRRPVERRSEAKVVGGSTITQQLAKNLFLSGERTVLRKAQELVITLMLEQCLSKARILEIYLNHVEWGEGVFGADAAARHYFRVAPAQLSQQQAARLAVMLPAPKRFEKRPASSYIQQRAGVIAQRLADVELP